MRECDGKCEISFPFGLNYADQLLLLPRVRVIASMLLSTFHDKVGSPI